MRVKKPHQILSYLRRLAANIRQRYIASQHNGTSYTFTPSRNPRLPFVTRSGDNASTLGCCERLTVHKGLLAR
jgi:hypothetical protein